MDLARVFMEFLPNTMLFRNNFVYKIIKRYMDSKKVQTDEGVLSETKGIQSLIQITKKLGILPVVFNKKENYRNDSEPLIIVSNHPLGITDTLALISLFSELGTKFKIVGTQFFQVFVGDDELLIPLDMSNMRNNSNTLRKSIKHLKGNGVLFIYPAGMVSGFNGRKVVDKEWHSTFVNLALKTGAKVLPLKIDAINSWKYYVIRFVLPRDFAAFFHFPETLNSVPCVVPIKMGSPINVQALKEDGRTTREIANFIKQIVYKL